MYFHEYGILGCKIFSEITSVVGAIGSIKEFPGDPAAAMRHPSSPPVANLTSATPHIKGKAARFVTPGTCLGGDGEKLSYV